MSDEDPEADDRSDPDADDRSDHDASDGHDADSRDTHDTDTSNGHDADVEADPFDDLEAPDDDPLDDPFEAVEVDEIDEDDVWAQIADDDSDTDGAATAVDGAELLADESDGADTDSVETLVDKDGYCQQCEFFSEPPEASCTHPGTDILELVDADTFRVRNCPIVERRWGSIEEVLED